MCPLVLAGATQTTRIMVGATRLALTFRGSDGAAEQSHNQYSHIHIVLSLAVSMSQQLRMYLEVKSEWVLEGE